MGRALRTVLALLVPLLVIAGCGPAATHAAAPSSSATAQDQGDAVPGDPAQSAGDAAPIDTSCPTSNTVAFAKTKFVAHAGLAFGAFHRYLWKPLQAGTFRKGASGRFAAFVKGGLAALFVKREVRLAAEDAKANPTLCRAIAAPLAAVGDTVQAAFDKAKSGDTSGLTSVNSAIGSVEDSSSRSGDAITENDDPDLASTPK